MRYLPIAILCLLLAACGSANESNTPTGNSPGGNDAGAAATAPTGAAIVVDDFLKLLLAGDREAAFAFLSKPEREADAKERESIGLNSDETMEAYTLGAPFEEDGLTLVPANITYNNGDPATDMEFVMVDEDGEWRIQLMGTIFRGIKKKKDE